MGFQRVVDYSILEGPERRKDGFPEKIGKDGL
jgi:hypothetical protein